MRLGWVLPLERLSASSMAKFASCPEQFRQKYLLKTREPLSGQRFMGLVDHKVTEQLVSLKDDPPLESGLDLLYARIWDETLDEQGEDVLWKEGKTAEDQFEVGKRMMHAYAEKVIPTINPVALEERVEFKVPGVPGKVIGYVDILEPHVIRERKTADKAYKKPRSDWRFQGLVYQAALGLPVRWDVVTSQVTPQVLTADEHPGLFLPLRSTDVLLERIRDIAWYMNDCYQRYGKNHPWPLAGVHHDWACSYCPIGIERGDGSCRIWKI